MILKGNREGRIFEEAGGKRQVKRGFCLSVLYMADTYLIVLKVKEDNKDDNLVMGGINCLGSGRKGTARTKVCPGVCTEGGVAV